MPKSLRLRRLNLASSKGLLDPPYAVALIGKMEHALWCKW